MIEPQRKINIYFVKEFKNFTSMFDKKGREDYILNVNKIIKDKFDSKFIVPNRVQSFLINYEIKKLLTKAISIKNRKYQNVIYLNSNLSIGIVRNAIQIIKGEFEDVNFVFSLIESADEDTGFDQIEDLEILRSS
jgi:hypothetical protein